MVDKGTIYPRAVYERCTAAADRCSVPWQTKSWISGGTDASAIQRRGEGAAVLTVSVPLRSIHSPASVGCIKDIEALPVLAEKILEEMAREN